MRQKFISREEYPQMTIEDAYRMCPWAFKVIHVDGGFHAFESRDDFNLWTNQK